MRAGVLLAASLSTMALALAGPAVAGHSAGPPRGAAGVLAPPAPSNPPTITGTARAGSTLTGNDGTWEGAPVLTRQWLRCDAAGSSCVFLHDTDLSHTLESADVGKRIRLRVLATTVGGFREVDSDPTPIVSAAQAPGPPPTVGGAPFLFDPPAVAGELREGETIVASPGIWLGSAPLTYATRWDRCDAERCVPTGKVLALNTLEKADVGMRVRARVTASNIAGSASAFTPQSAVVKARYARLMPFPVIRIKGVITGGGVRLKRLSVRAPSGSTLRLTCRGEGCPYRSARARLRSKPFLVRGMLYRQLPAGTMIQLRVTRRNRIGKYTRFRILPDRKPARVDRCLVPGEVRPSRCSPAS